MTTAREKELEDIVKALEAELAQYHSDKSKRKDLVKAKFIKYETWKPWYQEHLARRIIPGSPRGYNHNEVYMIPEAQLKFPWWKKV